MFWFIYFLESIVNLFINRNKNVFFAVFRGAPPTPPSYAAQQQTEEEVNFVQSLKNLFKNRSFMLLLVAYGINVGVFYAISTLLSEIILKFYEVSWVSKSIHIHIYRVNCLSAILLHCRSY